MTTTSCLLCLLIAMLNCCFFFHQEKSEKVVLDVVDQVFPTVLEKVLHSTPQSEKVLAVNCWLPKSCNLTLYTH